MNDKNMAVAFDTLAHMKKLVASGVPQLQAEAHVQALADIVDNKLATKKDIEDLKLVTKKDIEDTRKDIEDLKLATKKDIEDLKLVTKKDIADLRLSTKKDIEYSKNELKLSMGYMLTGAVVILSVLMKIL